VWVTLSYMSERRAQARKSVDIYFNKFLSGYPYLCRCVDLSAGGALVETYAEPETDQERFPVELRFPGDKDSLWLWAKRTRVSGTRQAFSFVNLSRAAARRLERGLMAA
jgi:hypothetical protein